MIEAIFQNGVNYITLSGLTQWDYGQQLKISGLDFPEVIEVHFSNNVEKEAIVMLGTKESNYVLVDIPDVLLEKSYDITAFIYIVGDNSGETVRSVVLKVEPRVKPSDYISQNPDAQEILEEAISKINANIADNTAFKEQLEADQEEYQAHWDAEVEQSITEAEQATNQCYDAIGALQLEIYDMNGGDPFTEVSDDDMDANGGYPA